MKAIVKNGLFVPQEPLPRDWTEGMEVLVEKTKGALPHGVEHPTDAWMDEVEKLASQGDPADDKRLEAALQGIRRQAKDLARKDLGLD
jgi:hypothetical protein